MATTLAEQLSTVAQGSHGFLKFDFEIYFDFNDEVNIFNCIFSWLLRNYVQVKCCILVILHFKMMGFPFLARVSAIQVCENTFQFIALISITNNVCTNDSLLFLVPPSPHSLVTKGQL